ncbi:MULTISPECIES: SPW repeat protein [Rhodococcus]|uniref:SPW repeat protein n=1 Tax=Rhodococcus pseudokoreensis TaxID=2811421 RepID=A0A974ZTK0_9NOCA|nr:MULTISPECIES: SPW repeat protein [Rhodococcus]KAF0960051.1 hypothetical protein MLGJGCBP_06803 [Rhodococcus sp. T7]OUS92707.1 hypothetical protein CA951_26745 [Rhodococcus sp. NCIMB 12038]QSE89754.1 SPW repeat protein [Rhodococcus pseudokoreensis]
MTTPGMSIERHPDIAELRARYDRVSEQPMTQVTEGLMFMAGLYMAASPWIVGFASQSGLATCNLLSGLAVALLAVGFTSAYSRTHGMAFVAPLLGLWMIVSPWLVVGVTTTAGMIWSNVVCGIIVCLLGLGLTAMGMADGGMRMRRR